MYSHFDITFDIAFLILHFDIIIKIKKHSILRKPKIFISHGGNREILIVPQLSSPLISE